MTYQNLSAPGHTAGFRILPAGLVFGFIATLHVLMAGTAQAATPLFGLYNTGVNPGLVSTSTTPEADASYQIAYKGASMSNASGAPGTAYVTDSSSFPLAGYVAWTLADDNTSRWISPTPSYADYEVDAGGYYEFSTSFDLAGYDPTKVSIQGRFGADDVIEDVLLNGHSLGVTVLSSAYSQFSPYFNLTANASFLNAGSNTLDFEVFNYTNSYGDPVALRTEFIASPVPEPSTLAAVGGLACMAACGGWLRRRRSTV